VLRRPRLYADLATAASIEPLLYYYCPRAETTRLRPQEGAQYAQDQLRLLEAVLDVQLPGGLPQQPFHHGRQRPADP
jgi:hypothetical protein